MSDIKFVNDAYRLAKRAHEGQVDKAGAAYILHVGRVAGRVHKLGPIYEAAGWLHDVLEDCPDFHAEFWAMPDDVVRAVVRVTRLRGQSPADYYSAIKADPVALAVKLADIEDNLDPHRLALVEPKTAARLRKKYKKALEMLA